MKSTTAMLPAPGNTAPGSYRENTRSGQEHPECSESVPTRTQNRNMSSKISLLLLSFITLWGVSPSYVNTWAFNGKNLHLIPAIPWLNPVSPIQQADSNHDGQPECLVLQSGQAQLYPGSCPAASSSVALWQSPPDWQVLQANFTDLNHDGSTEITLLLQRPFQPWPIDRFLPNGGRIADFHDAGGHSCHLILVGWKYGKYQEVWAGSALVDPLRSFAVTDLDGNSDSGQEHPECSEQELVVLEGSYADPPDQPAHVLSIWEWNGFGFSVLDRVNGEFHKLILATSPDGQRYILTER